jgi:hypothetical protein
VKSNDEAARMVSALFALELTSYPRTVSGMLFFDRRSKSVLQVLEGPLSTVRRLMDGVIVDDWHLGSVQILDERRIARRLHPDIGMTQALVQDDPNAVKMAQKMMKQWLATPDKPPADGEEEEEAEEESSGGAKAPSAGAGANAAGSGEHQTGLVTPTPPARIEAPSPRESSAADGAADGGSSSTATGDPGVLQRAGLLASTGPLLRLQCHSAFATESAGDAVAVLTQILAERWATHAEHGIGGLLVFNPTSVSLAQILEGPREAVMQLYEAHRASERHTACKIISQESFSKGGELFDGRWSVLQSEADLEADLVGGAARLRDAYRTYAEAHANTYAMGKAAGSLRSLGRVLITRDGFGVRGSPFDPFERPMVLYIGK